MDTMDYTAVTVIKKRGKRRKDDMEAVVGGKTNDAVHDLKNFVSATMSVPSGTYLVMQKTAGGAFMSVKYKNGDSIKVNNNFMERGYLLAYSPSKNVYGYVDAKYVRF